MRGSAEASRSGTAAVPIKVVLLCVADGVAQAIPFPLGLAHQRFLALVSGRVVVIVSVGGILALARRVVDIIVFDLTQRSRSGLNSRRQPCTAERQRGDLEPLPVVECSDDA